MASCKEIDKGYYRRCLIAYKLYMQNDPCIGLIYSGDMIEIGERTRQIYEELKLPHKKGFKKQGVWHTLTEYEKTDISVKFSEEKQIVSFLYDSHADDAYHDEGEKFDGDRFHDWGLDETLRKELLKNGGMIILSSKQLHKKDKDKQIRKIVSYLKNKAITINKSLRNKNFLTEIMRKKHEIKCFNLGHYFSEFYCDIQSRKYMTKTASA